MLARTHRKLWTVVATLPLATALMAANPVAARAEGTVTSTGKGIVGGTLLGGEVVDLTLAAVGVQRGWPYLVFGAVGAAGGGAGGYYLEGSASPSASIYMLAGGMALFIPTLVASLSASSYHPPETDRMELPAGASDPSAFSDSKGTDGALAKARAGSSGRVATSLVDLRAANLGLGVPAVEVRPAYTTREMAMYGVEQRVEVRVPVLQASF
jgi:hypothetical protein